MDEGTGKLYSFHKYVEGQAQTLDTERKNYKVTAASPYHLLFDVKLQDQGDIKR
jgi:hypothetical protein